MIDRVPLDMRWQVVGPGSAVWRWNIAGEELSIHSTYVGDALREIVRSALDLRLGSRSTFAHFLGEPGGTRIFFSGADKEVYVQIVSFSDLNSEFNRWSDGRPEWDGRVSTNGFIEAVRLMCERVLSEYGDEGYRRAWGASFPRNEIEELSGIGNA